jgi:nitroreductase
MLNAIRNRRSIRHYQPRPIAPENVTLLQEAMLRAPSSRNLQPWHFAFVTDPVLLEQLAHSKASYSDFLSGAALGVVVSAAVAKSDCWIEDCSIAAQTLMLAATELGLGTCWIQIRARRHADGRLAEEYVREVLGMPEELSVLCIISIGYPAEEKTPRAAESLSWDKTEVR